jgi:N-acyl amino acid synthase of PEP-CTERM/exosortase system
MHNIAKHFARYFIPVIASPTNKDQYRLRHRVYCEEMGFEESRLDGLEIDSHDSIATHLLIYHRTRGCAACLRVVWGSSAAGLPCFSDDPNPPNNATSSEISRMIVSPDFRRRKSDREDIDLLPVALALGATAILSSTRAQMTYALLDPLLLRYLHRIKLQYVVLDEVEHRGTRLLCLLNMQATKEELISTDSRYAPLLLHIETELLADRITTIRRLP